MPVAQEAAVNCTVRLSRTNSGNGRGYADSTRTVKVRGFEAEASAFGHVVERDVNGFAEAILTSRAADRRIADVVSADEAERRNESVFHLKPNSRIQRKRANHRYCTCSLGQTALSPER